MLEENYKDDGEETRSESACYWSAGLLPEHRPELDGEETLRVHDRSERGLIVEISDILMHPVSWGVYLADIAHVISRAVAAENDMTPVEAEALIRKGFTSDKTFLPSGR